VPSVDRRILNPDSLLPLYCQFRVIWSVSWAVAVRFVGLARGDKLGLAVEEGLRLAEATR
jgi:hypothetical protein